MKEFSSYTDDELIALAGGKTVPAFAYQEMSEDELAKLTGAEIEKPGIIQKVKGAVSTAIRGATFSDIQPTPEAVTAETVYPTHPGGTAVWDESKKGWIKSSESAPAGDQIPRFVQGKPSDTAPSFIDRITGKTGITPQESAEALMSVEAKGQGMTVPDLREKVTGQRSDIQGQFIKGVVNEALLGLPDAISPSRTPDTTGEQIASGAGRLVGFVLGAPGAVTKLVTKGIMKAAPKLAVDVADKAAVRAGKLAAAEAPGLAVGTMASAIGEATKQDSLEDALIVLGKAGAGGAVTGATFGATRGVIPGNLPMDRIKRIATGMAVLDLTRGGHPFDNRDLEQKVFDYGIDAFFLWKGLPKWEFRKFGREVQKILDREAANQGQASGATGERSITRTGQVEGRGETLPEEVATPADQKGGGYDRTNRGTGLQSVVGGGKEPGGTVPKPGEGTVTVETGRDVQTHEEGKAPGQEAKRIGLPPLQIEEYTQKALPDTQGKLPAPEAAPIESTPLLRTPEPIKTPGPEPDEAPEAQGANMADKGKFPVQRVAIADVKVDPDKFQFKLEVNKKGEQKPLQGDWNDLAAGNLILWEAKDGTRFVANGHHRLAHAERMGQTEVNAQILREADGYTVQDARSLAAEANIMEGKGTIYDHAAFFRGAKGYDETEAAKRGLKGRGYTIGKEATGNTYASFQARDITPEAAEAVAKAAPGNDALQGIGVKYAIDHPKADPSEISSFVRAMSFNKPTGDATEDLFGFDDTAIKDAEAQAKEVSRIIRSLQEEKQAISLAKSDKKIELAKKHGIDITDLDAVRKRMEEIDKEIDDWNHWYTNPELSKQVRGKAAQGQSENIFKGGGSSSADTGGYATRQRTEPPKSKGEVIEEYTKRTRRAIQLPEIVELARRLSGGDFPRLRNKIRAAGGRALGVFYHGGPKTGKIEALAKLGEDPELLAKVIAHELGHMDDWLPEKEMKRGNILGRIASLKGYLKTLLEEYPDSPNKVLDEADRTRLAAEAERQEKAKDIPDQVIVEQILKEVPKYETVGITPEIILDIMRGKTDRTQYPELYEYLAKANSQEKKEIVKQALKQIIDERVSQFGQKVQVGTEMVTEEKQTIIKGKKATKTSIEKRFRELLQEEIRKRRLYERDTIRGELKHLAQIWKPFDEKKADPVYVKYRYSGKELYAATVSIILNDPELVKKEAPVFWKAFWSYRERKPEFKAIYDEIQDRLHNPEKVYEERRKFIRGMAEKGGEQRKRIEELRKSLSKMSIKGMGREIYRFLVDRNKKVLEIEDRLKKSQDGKIRDDQRVSWWIEELPYINSEVGNYRMQVEKDVMDAAKAEGIDLVDLHEYMELRRAAIERGEKGIVSPGGIMGELAGEQLAYMEKAIGKEKYQKIEKIVNKFWSLRKKNVISVLKEADFLTPELMDYIQNNEEYATFRHLGPGDIEHMIKRAYGDQVGSHIYKQIGTLAEVDNVFVQTILKDMALIRAGRHHKARMDLLKFLAQHGNDGELVQAKRDPKGHKFLDPKDPNMSLVIVTPHGKAQGYYIDKELADIWKKSPDEAGHLMNLVREITNLERQIFVSKNPGWIIVNPVRDFLTTWKNLPKASMWKLADAYVETFVDAMKAGFGKLPEIEKKMLKDRMIVMDRQYRGKDVESEFEQEEKIQSYGSTPARYRNFVTRPLKAVVDFLDKLGKAGERHGKFAAARYLEKYEPGRSKEEIAHIIRTRAGTPNIYARGLGHNLLNNLFLFSNVNMQGYRASWESAKEAPGTYIWKTAALNILPKVMFAAATWGLFGDDMEKASKKVGRYYRRMYNVVPLGLTSGGNAVILTLPQDFTGQVVGGIFDAILQGEFSGPTGALGMAAEQTPYNFNPILGVASDLAAYYLFKANPVDYHYGRAILTDDEYAAGGKAAVKGMAREAWNELGGAMLYRWRSDRVKGVEDEMKDVLGAFPVNALGRFIRVTNTGEQEANREVVEPVKQEAAQRRLDLKERIIDHVNSLDGRKPELKDINPLYRTLKAEGLIEKGTSVAEFRKTYTKYADQTENIPAIDAITKATSNDEKVALMKKYRGEMAPAEYEGFKRRMRREGYISDEAMSKIMKDERGGK